MLSVIELSTLFHLNREEANKTTQVQQFALIYFIPQILWSASLPRIVSDLFYLVCCSVDAKL